jgi:pyruvate dehydrogenase E1 component alpha subunit
MIICREFDEQAFKLQRSGRMGTFPQNKGQEAAALGAAKALRRGADQLVPYYRENPAAFLHGLPMHYVLLFWMGDERGNAIPAQYCINPLVVAIGTQTLHATGMAWAFKLRKEEKIVNVFFGDGATSTGDFHEAMNFASVFQVPAVLVSNNNGWAISTPVKEQTHAETLAQKGIAYGIPSYRLDGMDVLASYVLVRDALQRAREGKGPTFIESLCYRFGAHTTADNPDLYRSKEEMVKIRAATDPIVRFRNYLVKKKLWDDDREKKLVEEIDGEVDKAAKEAEQTAPPTMDELFQNVFATMPGYLKDELEYYHKVSGGK